MSSDNPITKAYGPRTTNTDLTLFKRMGGEEKLDTIVDGVYKLMRDDKVIGKQFARFRLERLKDRTVDYLRGEFGGTEYTSSDLWISHSHLAVRNDWYDIMMKYYVKMLKKVRMPKQETDEILEALEKMRKPIVDPGQKLKEIYLRHCEKEDEKVGGSGWTVKTKRGDDDDADIVQKPVQQPSKPKPSPHPSGGKDAGQLPGAVESPAAKPAQNPPPSPKRRVRKASATSARRFDFCPALDGPPAELPSSLPSGAELLYRLSNRPMSGPRPVPAR